MNENQRGVTPQGMSLEDILYVVFRHRWKILSISALGIVVALILPYVHPIPYQSEAKLYIRYVLETRAPTQTSENDGRIRSPDARGDSIINTELEILTSRDLAEQVAVAIGPEKLLGKGHLSNPDAAAFIVQRGISTDVPKDSCVVRLMFQHKDPEIVQPVLSQLINSYFKKHAEIHAVGAFDDFLTQETDQLRSRLAQTEEALREAKTHAGITSLEETKKSYGQQMGQIQQQLLETEAELAERRAAVQELVKATQTPETISTNEAQSLTRPTLPSGVVDDYKNVCSLLQTLQHQQQALLATYSLSNRLVLEVGDRISYYLQTKRHLETQNPGLLAIPGVDAKTTAGELATGPRSDLVSETVRVTALEAKVGVLTSQLDHIRKQAAIVAEAEGSITELQRRRDLEEAHYRKFSENLAQSQLDEKLGAGKVSNISVIEEPTPPRKAKSKLLKMMVGVLFGSIAASFGLAFLLELFLDQSIRRPAEVETKVGLPLFLSIPLLPNGEKNPAQMDGQTLVLTAGEAGEAGSDQKQDPTELGVELVPPQRGPLGRYYEALREKLITFFEMKNLIHKPKLVAVTSCSSGSGVSTTAIGLAASLSETGDGDVLLVNMNVENGTAHHFRKGELARGLELALEADTRNGALIRDNLYVVSEDASGEQFSPVLPKRFKQLVPRLKASDFDYIIFDMPPVNQISVTPRLTRFMDVVLMVIESGKTHRDVVKKASALLAEFNPNVGIVLNKGREYVPQWLKQDN